MNDTLVNPDDVPTDVVEYALRYATASPQDSERAEDVQPPGLSVLCLTLESRLANAQRLIHRMLWQQYDQRDALHAFGTLEHLGVEALELCWAIRDLGFDDEALE
ncbi:MAG TPA: hypothetical protein VIM98_07085 [Dyella sp.]|uniref:hypothetical protein n=1 Tax=Dyella sp. TaxID=1869338 RepID=UPI002F93BB65